MGRKNQFNMYDTTDLPVSSIKDLKVQQVKDTTPTTKVATSRFKKAQRPTEDLSETERVEKTTNNQKSATNTKTKTVKGKKTYQENVEDQDLESLNEQNILQHGFRSRRNKVIIYILAALLIVAVAVITVYAAVLRLKNTCFLYIEGADAAYIVDGQELSEFRAPQGITGNIFYQFDLDLKINSGGEYYVKFKIELYQGDEQLDNVIVYPETTGGIFREGSDGYHYSRNKVSGNQTINMCQGVLIDIAYKDTLNINNFKMTIYTYLY